jgi:hypothetical protein
LNQLVPSAPWPLPGWLIFQNFVVSGHGCKYLFLLWKTGYGGEGWCQTPSLQRLAYGFPYDEGFSPKGFQVLSRGANPLSVHQPFDEKADGGWEQRQAG